MYADAQQRFYVRQACECNANVSIVYECMRHICIIHMYECMRYICTARSVENETRNAELNGNRNPECWGDFSQLVKIEKIKYLGISRYKVELRFRLDLNSEVSRGTNSK